jgi:hypothetical protein
MKTFCQQRTRERAKRQALSQLACIGRHTITGLACTAGRQFVDGSGDYRLYSRDRWEVRKIFEPIVGSILELLPSDMPFVVGTDDTLVHKTGRKIRGVGYGRDPLSPPFHVNLVLRQRFLQMSGMLTTQGGCLAGESNSGAIRARSACPQAQENRSTGGMEALSSAAADGEPELAWGPAAAGVA